MVGSRRVSRATFLLLVPLCVGVGVMHLMTSRCVTHARRSSSYLLHLARLETNYVRDIIVMPGSQLV